MLVFLVSVFRKYNPIGFVNFGEYIYNGFIVIRGKVYYKMIFFL